VEEPQPTTPSPPRRSLGEGIFEQLRGRILHGDLSPGASLPPERVLCERFGVNRGAVREALKRLEQIRLVAMRQGGPTRVRPWRETAGLEVLPALVRRGDGRVDPVVVRSLAEMRGVLGPDVARRAAERAGPVLAARVRERGEALAAAAGDLPALQQQVMDFWDVLVEASGNLAYRLAFNSLREAEVRFRRGLRAVLADELRDLRGYAAIVRAVDAGDGEAAERAARKVVQRGTRAIARAMGAGSSSGGADMSTEALGAAKSPATLGLEAPPDGRDGGGSGVRAVLGLLALGVGLSPLFAAPAGACPALLEGLPARTNAIEAGLGATNANAAVGDGGLTATVSRCGELTSLKWPSPSFYDHLQYVTENAEDARLRPHLGALEAMGAFAGIAWETARGSGFDWLRDPAWEVEQRYTLSTSGVVQTSFHHPGLRLRVVQYTFVLPERDVLAHRFVVTREPGSRVREARVLFYANFAPTKKRIPFFPVGDTGLDYRNDFALLYDSREEAFLHYLPSGTEEFTSLLAAISPYRPDFSRLNPLLQSPPGDSGALRQAVQGLVDGLPSEDDGVYLAFAAHAGDDGFQAGFDDAPQCIHQTGIARRAVEGFGLPPALAPLVGAVFACENTVGPEGQLLGSSGPLAACRAANGWVHEAESAYRDAADGELSGSPIAACHANAALARDLRFRGRRAEATFYVAAGASRDQAYAALRSARVGDAGTHQADTEKWWDGFLAPALLPDTDDPEVLRFSRRALASLRTATDRRTTAMVASVATQPPYGLDWPRDGAFLNFALDQAGYHDLVTEHNLLYAAWQRRTFEPWSLLFTDRFRCPANPGLRSFPDCVPPGTWEMNYYAVPDAIVPGGPFSFEIDTAGLAVWTLEEHIQHVTDPEARARYLHGTGDPSTQGVCPAIRRGADALADCRDPEGSGLQCAANEDDNIELTQGLQGAETVLLALESAVAAAPDCGFGEEAVAGWEIRAEELREALVREFREELPRPHLAGDRPAWALWPVQVLPYDDPLMVSHAEYLREALVDPVLDRTAPVLGYNSQNMIARAQRFRALGDAAALEAMEPRVRFFIREGTTPGTLHMAEFAGRVDQDLDGDGVAPDYRPQNDVPHVWQQAYLYTTAMLVFGEREDPAPRRCDTNGDGAVDRRDVLSILTAGREAATGLLDPRDFDEDGRIDVSDAHRCTLRCDQPGCGVIDVPPTPGGGGRPCGLLGVEAGLVLLAVRALRPRRRRGSAAG